MWSTVVSTVVQLIPVNLQVSRASGVNVELGNIAFWAREPFAHDFAGAARGQDVGIVVLYDGGLVVPGGTPVDQLRIDAGYVDGEWSYAFEAEGSVLGRAFVDYESETAYVCSFYVRHIEVDSRPAFVATGALVAC